MKILKFTVAYCTAPIKKYLGHQEDPSTLFSSLFNLSFKWRLHNTSTTFIGKKTLFAAFSVDLFTFVTYGDSAMLLNVVFDITSLFSRKVLEDY